MVKWHKELSLRFMRDHDVPRNVAKSQRGRQHRNLNGARWADTKEERRPSHNLRGRVRSVSEKRQFLVPYYFGGALVIVLLGVAIGSFFVSEDPKVQANSEQTSALQFDPLKMLPEKVVSNLLAPKAELGAELKRIFTGAPEDICNELSAIGLENPGWQKAPFAKNRWQCATKLAQLTTPSVDFGSTTLFVLVRGPAEDKADYLRLKLVVEDKRQKEIGLDAVWLVIGSLASRYGWTMPDNFRYAIANFENLESTYRGVRLSVSPENPKLTGDPLANQRMNITINFGDPDLVRSAEKFVPSPPLEPDWLTKDQGGQGAE